MTNILFIPVDDDSNTVDMEIREFSTPWSMKGDGLTTPTHHVDPLKGLPQLFRPRGFSSDLSEDGDVFSSRPDSSLEGKMEINPLPMKESTPEATSDIAATLLTVGEDNKLVAQLPKTTGKLKLSPLLHRTFEPLPETSPPPPSPPPPPPPPPLLAIPGDHDSSSSSSPVASPQATSLQSETVCASPVVKTQVSVEDPDLYVATVSPDTSSSSSESPQLVEVEALMPTSPKSEFTRIPFSGKTPSSGINKEEIEAAEPLDSIPSPTPNKDIMKVPSSKNGSKMAALSRSSFRSSSTEISTLSLSSSPSPPPDDASMCTHGLTASRDNTCRPVTAAATGDEVLSGRGSSSNSEGLNDDDTIPASLLERLSSEEVEARGVFGFEQELLPDSFSLSSMEPQMMTAPLFVKASSVGKDETFNEMETLDSERRRAKLDVIQGSSFEMTNETEPISESDDQDDDDDEEEVGVGSDAMVAGSVVKKEIRLLSPQPPALVHSAVKSIQSKKKFLSYSPRPFGHSTCHLRNRGAAALPCSPLVVHVNRHLVASLRVDEDKEEEEEEDDEDEEEYARVSRFKTKAEMKAELLPLTSAHTEGHTHHSPFSSPIPAAPLPVIPPLPHRVSG